MNDELTDLLRGLAPQVVGVLTRRCGDFAAAEDATQEALIAAAACWPGDGVPDNPRGWLIRAGERKLVDQVRGEQARRRREALVAAREPAEPARPVDRDDSLAVLLMCCHPALPPASAIALTLRAVGGLSTAEIAEAFLVPEETMTRRISRAKKIIRDVGIQDRREVTPEARRVLYLIFNAGHLRRRELSAEAIRLTRMIQRPDDTESAGLLALMLLSEARRPARATADGDLVPLDEQDRTRWDQALIKEGTRLLDAAFRQGSVGEYQLQAAIAALHDRAERAADTDWPQIRALYGVLERMTASPVVTLNHAVATAMVDGPAAGLAMLAELDRRLPDHHHRLHAVRAHLHELAGDQATALDHYRAAAARATSAAEQRYLTLRAARLARRAAT
ncbi:sigma-70 family RNA polymerase sigma factor [Asanoa sp. NPDC050611]|uniref:RNA polymerase sigma factor n=1 Tax=Asanoa sp. NPDC050611 TaxID=3157098 RepID=UPI0034080AA4